MNLSITALNEKLNTKDQTKATLITWNNIKKTLIIILLASVCQTMTFRLGVVFIIPVMALTITYNKRAGLILAALIGLSAMAMDFKGSLSILLGILLLLTFSSESQYKLTSHLALFSISILSYGVNIFLDITPFNPFVILFIGVYTYIFYIIFNKALEIKIYNYNADREMFPEEIIALLGLSVCLLMGLFLVEWSLINIGYILAIGIIILLGIVSSPIYILGYTVVIYLLLHYTNLTFDGGQVIPFIGLVSAFVPKQYIKFKTFIYYLLSPLLFYFGLMHGNVLFVLINLSLATKIYYFSGSYLLKNYSSLLVHRNNESNLYHIYIENFKEDISRRLLNFGEIFETFANKSNETNNDLQKIDESMNEIVEKHCKNCLKKELCLNTNYIKTYNYLTQILREGNLILDESKKRFIDLFNMYCLNAYEIINTAIYLNEEYLLNNTKTESIVYQSQLHGLSRIIQNYALELNSHYENDNEKILKFKEGMNKLGISISYFKINNMSKHNLNVEMGLTTKEDLDHGVIKERFESVFKEEIDLVECKTKRGIKKYKIQSKKEFELDFGTSYIGKDGNRICGDNFIKCDNHQGNTVIALCDGMGTGYSAHIESKTTLELLNKMLDTGADDEMSVSVINTLVSLKEYKERFSTLDYLVINRSIQTVDFYKIGSAPSFIIRGSKVIRIDNDNLPIGFSSTLDKVSIDIEIGDIIVVVSDGVVDRLNNLAKFENILTKLAKNTPIQMAHDIIQVVIKENNGKILDDMTAIVLKVTKNNQINEAS